MSWKRLQNRTASEFNTTATGRRIEPSTKRKWFSWRSSRIARDTNILLRPLSDQKAQVVPGSSYESEADTNDVRTSTYSFQQEVLERSRNVHIGRHYAETEVYVNRLITEHGDVDKALFYVLEVSIHDDKYARFQVQSLVNLILNRGADPQVTNESLRTALHYAVEKGFIGVCRKLLNSGDWPVKLTRDIEGNTPLTLALRCGNDEIASLIITYMYHSDVRSVFICPKSGEANRAEFALQPFLKNDMENTVMAILDCLMDQHENTGNWTIYYDILEADESGRPPTHPEFNCQSKSALQQIAKIGNKNIVYHDVVRLLVRRKWKAYAMYNFVIRGVIYLLSLFALTFAVVVVSKTNDSRKFDTPLDIIRHICEGFVILVLLVQLCLEANQLRKYRLEYFMDRYNWFDLSSVFCLLTVIPLRYTQHPHEYQVYAVGYVLWTIRITQFAIVFRQTGAYTQILARIMSHDFTQFMLCFVVILLAFSGAFVLSLKGEGSLGQYEDIESYWLILFLGIRILIEAESIIDYTKLGPMSCALMVLFLFTTAVVLLNILIAQLSDTYQNIQNDAQRGLAVNKTWIVAREEQNDESLIGSDYRIKHYKAKEEISDIRRILYRREKEMIENIQDITHEMHAHVQTVTTIQNRLVLQESSLRIIQNQLQTILNALDANTTKQTEEVDELAPNKPEGTETKIQ